MESVCAVVVTYNRKNLLRRCLTGLLSQTRPIDEILVVDNASDDGTHEMLTLEFPQIKQLRLTSNTGGAGGFHIGVRKAYEKGHSWVWIMDDDVLPDSDALSSLLKAAEELKREKGMRGFQGYVLVPVRLWEDKNLAELAALRYDLCHPFLLPHQVRLPLNKVYATYQKLPEMQIVEDCSFEGPLIPRTAIEKVGFPTKEYFIFGDDTDYAFRLRHEHYGIVLVRASRLYRMLRPLAGHKTAPWKLRYEVRNRLWLTRLYGENVLTRHFRPILWGFRYLLAALVKLKWLTDSSAFVALYQGVKEGLLGSIPKHANYRYIVFDKIQNGGNSKH